VLCLCNKYTCILVGFCTITTLGLDWVRLGGLGCDFLTNEPISLFLHPTCTVL